MWSSRCSSCRCTCRSSSRSRAQRSRFSRASRGRMGLRNGWALQGSTIRSSFSWQSPFSTTSSRIRLTSKPLFGRGLKALSILTVLTLSAGFALVFFYAPLDADQGVIQKIFYVHVPLAIVTLCGFIAGGLMAIQHLRTRDRAWDMRSYVAIHLSIIFGVAVLITGSLWAKRSWGHWWVWDEPVLVSYLIVFLLYCCYQPLRFSISDPERQPRYAPGLRIAAGAFVPINFVAVRLAVQQVHPRVLSETGGHLPGKMMLAFYVALLGVALLYATLWKLALTSKNASEQLKRLRARLEATPLEGPAGAPPPPVTTVPARPEAT